MASVRDAGFHLISGMVHRMKSVVDDPSSVPVVGSLMALLKKTTRHEVIFTPRYGVRTLKDSKLGSYSGPGSTVKRTAEVQNALPRLLEELDCKIFIDAPCGDFKWMQHVELPVERYVGVDVIRDLIEINTRKFSNEKRSFVQMDLVRQVLPTGDLVFNRDMLIHLSYRDIARFISLLKQSGSKYLLTSHFPEQTSNHDIRTGSWRPVNLEISPFDFPAPVLTISERYRENRQHADKCLALWKIADLPSLDRGIGRTLTRVIGRVHRNR
jgi:hypothetical protein